MAAIDGQASEGSFSFDPFAQHPFYTAVNRALVEQALAALDQTRPPGVPLRLVELASGTGAVTELILDALAQHGRTATVVGLEPSPAALALARDRLAGRPVTFVQGDATALGSAVEAIGAADAAFCCNALHLMADKDAGVAALANVLTPGGILACNTTFYDGAYVAGSQPFYYALMRQSLAWLRTHHPEVRVAHQSKSTARQWLSAQDYRDLVGRHGLDVILLEEQPVEFSLRAVQDIGRYSLFIEGALPGVPWSVGAEALGAAAAQAFADLQLSGVPRNWLQVIARRNA
jgi:ubiquinone/menaquinone biosynthesis C-methylase UbiE